MIRHITRQDLDEVAALQALAFPPPFNPDLLWQREHLLRHLERFPAGQFLAESDGIIVGSCSNTLITEEAWIAHGDWMSTVGGPMLDSFASDGSTLYGLDITVHPDHRRLGIAKAFYRERFSLVRNLGLTRYGTACRIPDFQEHGNLTVEDYARAVVAGEFVDRTLTPLLRIGLTFLGVIHDYMEDVESGHAAALLEWRP